MIKDASAPVDACVAIISCRASSVVGTSKTNGMASLIMIGMNETKRTCE